MMKKSISKDWFIAKYKIKDGSSGYIRLKQEAVNRIHHNVALSAIEQCGRGTEYMSLVDIGCACGDFTSHVTSKFEVKSAIGLDFVREGLNLGRNRYPHITFVEAALPDIPIQDGAADLVLAMEVLYYLSVEDLKLASMEIARICADDGYVVVSVNLGDGLHELSEIAVLELFLENFVHCGTIYEHALLQKLLHTQLGRLIRVGHRIGIPVLPQLALRARDNMIIANINYAIARYLLRARGITKGVYVFRKQC